MEINCGQGVLTTLSDLGILERADNCSNMTLAVKYFVLTTLSDLGILERADN